MKYNQRTVYCHFFFFLSPLISQLRGKEALLGTFVNLTQAGVSREERPLMEELLLFDCPVGISAELFFLIIIIKD